MELFYKSGPFSTNVFFSRYGDLQWVNLWGDYYVFEPLALCERSTSLVECLS